MANFTAFAELSLHSIGEEGLLLDRAHQRLYALNASAVFIWSLLKEGKSATEIIQSLHEQFEVPPDTAMSHITEVLRQYETLLRKPSDPETAATVAELRLRVPIGSDGEERRPNHGGTSMVETYSLLDSVFRVHYDCARLAEEIHPLLQHRVLTNATEETAVTNIVVASENGGVAIIADKEMIGSSRTVEDAAVAVRACLTQLAVAATGGLCVVHAGALQRNDAALLLPGDAGHGKSTLSAGLVARGFDMLCDDTTLLSGEPPVVRSIPTGLCVKRGAYAVLDSLYPRLSSLPEWRRPDGKWARYLMPDRDLRWAAPEASVRVRQIVFPRYHPDCSTTLLPLSRHEALARLLRGAYFMSGSLDELNLEKFIAWIEQIDCFELPLSSLDTATTLLDGLCQ